MRRHLLLRSFAVSIGVMLAGCGLAACFDWATPPASGAPEADGGGAEASIDGDGSARSDAPVDAPLDAAALPACGPPLNAPGALSFHAELDDLAGLATPAMGSGAGFTTTASSSDFVPGICRNALRVLAGVHLSYLEKDPGLDAGGNVASNIDYGQGTLMLWYRPDYPDSDTAEHYLIRGNQVVSRGGIRLSRTSTGIVHFGIWDASGTPNGSVESSAKVTQGTWVHVGVSWRTGEAPRMFLDGVLDTKATSTVVGGQPTAPSDTQSFGIGNFASTSGELPATGLIDDVRIYPVAMP